MVESAETDRRPILTFYGDDFTGSTDSLEALAMAGAPAVLFLDVPTPEMLARHPGAVAVGVAGTSRSRSPDWMDRELPAIFAGLKALGAPICHYKTCSTFDSAPDVGSIGRAADIGRRVFGGFVPCVVGVTRHRRYVTFSNLFAAAGIGGATEIFRIDRHPTMSRHPVTPMGEADLRRHLAAQTASRIAGFDFLEMLAEDGAARLAAIAAEADIVVFDTFDAATTRATGRLLAAEAAKRAFFTVGSSGVEYALVDHLTATGVLPIAPPPTARPPVDRLIAVCGSCSPITERQIARAEADGFASIAVDTVGLVEDDGPATRARIAETILAAFADHDRVVVHTARGGDDPRLGPTRDALARRGLDAHASSAVLGGALGRVVGEVLKSARLTRAVLAGGDSSSHAVSAMGVSALEVAGPLVPGAPLCRLHSSSPHVDGVEISLKGGQVGGPDFFGRVAAGR